MENYIANNGYLDAPSLNDVYQLSLDLFQSAALGAVVLVVGMFLVKRSNRLAKYCIPAAVVGGILFSLVMLVFYGTDVMEIRLDNTVKDIAMRIFFCSIGFMASFKMLKSGGRMIIVMMMLMVVLVVMQNVIGVASVSIFGMDSRLGLALGSISLSGGHGTAAAYGELLVEDYGVEGADVVAIAAATFGLVIAGLMGGPIANRLIEKNHLKPDSDDFEMSAESEEIVNKNRFLTGLIILLICTGLGTLINEGFAMAGIALPTYLGAMIVAIIVRNAADLGGYDLPVKETELIGWLCLSVFLAMALMGMKLWQLEDLALAMIFTLILQTVALAAFVYFLIFRLTGRNFESAALATGTMGFGMGATPNAVANVGAIMNEYGPAPKAYFAVPIIGAAFLDVINVAVLTAFLNIL